ncbi:MAG: AIDA repeat-containing protein [Lentisphaeria bacterium]|nr:AIDA repeat-containing protein [Lentisphaeria bacterium]
MLYEITNGVVRNGITLYRDSMTIWSGGEANSTTVSMGNMYISSGGIANSTTLNNFGFMDIKSGGEANNTTVNSYGRMFILSGGVANNTTVNSNGRMIINSGGVVTELYLKAGGALGGFSFNEDKYFAKINGVAEISHNVSIVYNSMLVSSGGEANSTTIDGGSMYISSGGIANSTTVNSWGFMDINSGGEANSTTVNSWGFMDINSGGEANSTTVNSGGSMHISSGGLVTELHLNAGGVLGGFSFNEDKYFAEINGVAEISHNVSIVDSRMFITSGGVANNTTVSSGSMYISSGGVTNSTTVNYYGSMNISSGGVANRNTVTGGHMDILSGGVADSTTVNSAGDMYISGGGTANRTTVNSSGYMSVLSGGTANSTTVNSSGYMYVLNGGTANSTTVNSSGYICISSGGLANSTTVNSVGAVHILSGGTANITTIKSSGHMHVSDGGVADEVIIREGGGIYVASGGTASVINDNPWGVRHLVFSDCGAEVSYIDRLTAKVYISSGGVITSADTLDGFSVTDGGDVVLLSGGIANNTTVNSGGTVHVSSGGAMNSTTMQNGWICVSDGGAVSNTSVYGGILHISGDGEANSTTVNSGTVHIYSGGAMNSTTMQSGWICVSGGGAVSNTSVDGGILHISGGGLANSTTVNSGTVHIFEGGTANSILMKGGWLCVSYGGTATIVRDNPFGVLQGTVTSDYGADVSYIDRLTAKVYISSGADITSADTLDDFYACDCDIVVLNGGRVTDITLDEWNANMTVSSGAVADTITVNGGWLCVGSGGVAEKVTNRGRLYVSSGGTATVYYNPFSYGSDITSEYGATVTYLGIENKIHIYSAGQSISRTDVLNDYALNSGHSAVILSGGTATGITVKNGGELYVSSGGSVSGFSGVFSAFSGAVVNGAVLRHDYMVGKVFSSNVMLVGGGFGYSEFDSYMLHTQVLSGGSVYIYEENISFENTTIRSGGIMNVTGYEEISGYSGDDRPIKTTFDKLVVEKGGEFIITRKGDVSNGDISGVLTMDENTVLSKSVIKSGGIIYLLNRAKGEDITVSVNANLYVDMAAQAKNITIDGGAVHVAVGGVISDVDIKSDGKLFVYGGAILDGKVNVSGTLCVGDKTSALEQVSAANAEILLDLSARTSDDGALVDNISKITGVDDFTVTVSDTQTEGAYKLAGGAAGFDGAITVGNGSVEYGTLTLENSVVKYENMTFELTENQGDLMLDYAVIKVDNIAPTLTISGNPTAWVKSATLKAAASDASGIKLTQYSFDNKTWTTGTSVTVTKNGTVYFKTTDNADNVTTKSVSVTKIDNTAPTLTISGNPTTWAKSATLKAVVSDAGGIKLTQYSFDNKNWTTGTSVTVTQNRTVYFKTTDNAGNVTSKSVSVTKIDNTSPTLTISGNPTSWAKSATLKAVVSDASGIKLTQYSFDNKTWTTGTSVTVTQNRTVYFKTTDNAGNVTSKSVAVTKIRTEEPKANLLSNGVSQIVGWDKEKGAVGFVATDGVPGNKWRGVWDWDGKDVDLWRVVGVGHFAGSKVDHDGILLYNGIGTTFAAWTNLNDPSYGYVNLCHVEGNFNTKCLTDLDSDQYDDVLIYDEKGSFGVVLDGATYKDIWHVDNAKTNPWQLCGAGSFGGTADKLVVKNTSGHLYLWTNNDPTFKTWNWSQSVLGYIGNDFEFVDIGDFKGDGKDDILLKKKADGGLWVWDDGNASTARWVVTPEKGFEVEGIGDYNGDGKEDILVREYNTKWGGCGYYAPGGDKLWNDLNARIETGYESNFAIIA